MIKSFVTGFVYFMLSAAIVFALPPAQKAGHAPAVVSHKGGGGGGPVTAGEIDEDTNGKDGDAVETPVGKELEKESDLEDNDLEKNIP
ncbi:MAG: hypothetical protein PHS37_03845 [Candidatus Omnitrophica bacterium]|nr:hypothetical protein [Candidatus Omnitrophota bacterium]